MNIILLSGGSGKRLWPLSNDIRSKQFIRIFKNNQGEYESMVQRVYGQIKAVDPKAVVTIATLKSQVSEIHHQLGTDVRISVEPCRRDTFAAIALATAYLHDIQGLPETEAVVVCPVDPYVDLSYFHCVNKLYEAAIRGERNLLLMGIQPSYPSEKYGYIRPVPDSDGQKYIFSEKPTKETAQEYIRQGAMWSGGVFAYQLRYVLDKSRELLGTDDYQTLFANYAGLRRISFDYAVVEAETSIGVIQYSGQWKDLGTWNTLTEVMKEPVIGNGRLNDECRNVHIVNELDIPVIGMGLHDVIISASPEGILVSDKEQSSLIQPFAEAVDQQIMFAEKSWGSYRVLDIGKRSIVIRVTLKPGKSMNYHSHQKRDEIWVAVSGSGKAIVDGEVQSIGAGDVIQMRAGQKHTVIAEERELQLIEIQCGEEITVLDKTKYRMP